MKLTSKRWYFDSTDGNKAYYCWGERLLPVTAADVSKEGHKAVRARPRRGTQAAGIRSRPDRGPVPLA